LFSVPPFSLILVLIIFYRILGCFLDGFSMIVMTLQIVLPGSMNAGKSFANQRRVRTSDPPCGLNNSCEPNIAAVSFIELTERRELHHTPILDAKPALPMLAICVADVRAPLSGPIFNSSSKSTTLHLARSLSARLVAASSCAFWDDGMPQRSMLQMVLTNSS
jgi:hypothetical protein